MIASPRQLERTRRKAASLADGLNAEDGWVVDTTAALNVVALFPRLSVRRGYSLATLAVRVGAGGNGWTFAIPDGSDPPSARELERAAVWPPEPPRGALARAVDAVDGDETLRSYLQASVLRRELEELGAWWHGLEWRMHTLLDNGLAPDAPDLGADSGGQCGPSPEDPHWHWETLPPDDWRPVAERTGPGVITVRLFTISGLGGVRIARHVDVYRQGSLSPQCTEVTTIANGPGGFVF